MKKETKEHRAWRAMKYRCLSPSCAAYPNYGGRGITICDRWINSFESFIEDMGPCPDGLTLERVDNDLGYCKENCIWATVAEQNRNRRDSVKFTVNGITKNQSEWIREFNLPVTTFTNRLDRGWSVEKALKTPIQDQVSPSVTLGGITKTIRQWANGIGIKQTTALNRIGRGWTLEKALTTPLMKRS